MHTHTHAHAHKYINTRTILKSYAGPLSPLGNLFMECWAHLRQNLIEIGANLIMARSGGALCPASPPASSHLVVLTATTLLFHFMPHGSAQRCPLIRAALIVNPTFDMHHAYSVLILFFLFGAPPLLLFTPSSPPFPPVSLRSPCPHPGWILLPPSEGEKSSGQQ